MSVSNNARGLIDFSKMTMICTFNMHQWIIRILAIIAVLCGATAGYAITLKDLTAMARANNADLLRAMAAYDAAVAKVPQAKSLPNPELQFEVMGANRNNFEQSVRVAQMFPWPGTLGSRENAAALQAKALWHEAQAVELAVVAELRRILAELAYLNEKAALVRENLSLYEKQIAYLEQSVRGGGAASDLLRIEMEAQMLGDELAGITEMQERALAELSAITGTALRLEQIGLVELSKITPMQRDRIALHIALETENPLLQAQDCRVEAAKFGVKLAKLETRPELMFSVGYRYSSADGMGGQKDTMNEGIAMFSISLPIWGDKSTGMREEAKAMLKEVEYEREGLLRMIKARLEAALSLERDAFRRIQLYEEVLLPKARQVHTEMENRYRTGMVSLLELLESRRQLLEVETGKRRAIADAISSRAAIDSLFGTTIEFR